MPEKTFHLDVDDIGHFEFRHRTMRDEMRIGAEYSRLTEGVDTPSPWLDLMSTMISVLKVLQVAAPDGWDVDDADPLDDDSYKQIVLVYNALREREARFRGGDGSERKETGEGNGGVNEPVVQTNLPAATE